MAEEIRVTPEPEVGDGRASASGEPSLADLIKQLAQDSSTLVRQEMALAKAEMRENVQSVTRDVAMIAVGGGLLLVGLLALTAFLIAALGDALDNYWLAALIVGAVFAIIGGILAASNMKKLKGEGLKPDRTIHTLQEDKRWLQNELQEAKRDLA